MSAVATAVIAVGAYSAYSANKSGKQAAGAATTAANTAAASEQASLDYLKEREAIPQQFREEALQGLGGLYGLEGGTGNQQELIDRAIQSPLYKNIMGGKEAGEESILRSASATGGLRSGNTSANMYNYNTQLQNKALLESYNQQLMGLQGMAGLPSNTNQIAQGISNVGQIQGQGQVAAGQAIQTGNQQSINNMMGVAGLGLEAYKSGMFSDKRLKTNIKKIGTVNGFNFYSFDWNHIANMLGLKGSTFGCIADEVIKIAPEAIIIKNNFMMINYSTIGVL